jgi:hypothetical protein
MSETLQISAGEELFCPQCGYSLRGIESARCPECGHTLNWERISQSQIPWVHRKQVGRWRAYWRTLKLTMLDSRAISDEVQRAVKLEDALKFRRMSVWLVFVPLAIAVVGLYGWGLWKSSELSLRAWDKDEPGWVKLGAAMDWGMLPVLLGALYLLLLALTGVQSYFFHPRSIPVVRQNRAVALSYYGCGAVVWLPVSLGSFGLVIGLTVTDGFHRMPLLVTALSWIVGTSLFVLPPICGWINMIRLLGRTTQCGKVRQVVMAVTLPVLWAALIAIVGLGIPAAYAFVCLVVLSLK